MGNRIKSTFPKFHHEIVQTLGVAALVAIAGCGALPARSGIGEEATESSASGVRQQNDAASPASMAPPSPRGLAAAGSGELELALDPTRTVYFDIAGTSLSAQAREVIQNVARQLISNRNLALRLIGRTDDLGSKEICVAIANKRTRVVEDELVKDGVNIKQIRKYTRGCETAANRGCSSEGCRKQRRSVEMQIIDKS